MNENPWKKLDSAIKYENPWIKVRQDSVITPNGQPGIYSVVETRIATGVIALTEDRQIYLVGQYRYPIDKYSWEIVEGGVDQGEEVLTGAQRELEEEAGLKAKSWRQLGDVIHLSNCHSSEEAYLYVAEDLIEVQAQPDPTEILELQKVSFSRALELVMSGEITDGLSIIGILRLAREFELNA